MKRHISRLLTPLALPLFILLHILFTIFSLALRTYQTFTTPTAETIDIEHVPPPKHIALVIVPGKRRRECRKREKEAFLQSVRRVVQWAGERGVREVSIWDGQGMTQSAIPTLVRTLAPAIDLPPSPPSSPPTMPTQDPGPAPSVNHKMHSRQSSDSTVLGAGVTSMTFGAQVGESQQAQEVLVHFLPPSSSAPAIAGLTRGYATSSTPSDGITVRKVDEDLKKHLHFKVYPDLLIIHHLSPPPLHASLLPRKAPELWGYPFWALRITEIYQPPTPLPFLHHLIPLSTALRTSSYPSIRKLGYGISPPLSPAESALSKEEWDGAMRAWVKVEQRLGR